MKKEGKIFKIMIAITLILTLTQGFTLDFQRFSLDSIFEPKETITEYKEDLGDGKVLTTTSSYLVHRGIYVINLIYFIVNVILSIKHIVENKDKKNISKFAILNLVLLIVCLPIVYTFSSSSGLGVFYTSFSFLFFGIFFIAKLIFA